MSNRRYRHTAILILCFACSRTGSLSALPIPMSSSASTAKMDTGEHPLSPSTFTQTIAQAWSLNTLPAKRLVLPASAPHIVRKTRPKLLPLFSLPLSLHNRLYYDARDDSPLLGAPSLKGREQAQRKPDDRKAHAAGTIRAYTRTPIHRACGAVYAICASGDVSAAEKKNPGPCVPLLHLPTLSLVVAALLYTLLTLLTTAAPAPPPALSMPDPVCAASTALGAGMHMTCASSLRERRRCASSPRMVVCRSVNSARCVDCAPPPPPAIHGATNSGLVP
ncbi:hypothetical protein C8F04DRAFT_1338922 [Mycena alexandri]|uniref:Uncharacterized protein n=1 Tax=Mycena alexandri TaxID=1745969 RepID=A0AAD6SYP3_9AGAR|nr:hypothetical protein C8F04DRAFT_1338922 [Mycena alexandri]